MTSTIDLFIFVGIAVTSIGWIYFIGRMDEEKAKREMKKRHQLLKRGATNYARFQAVLVTSSKVIRRGSF